MELSKEELKIIFPILTSQEYDLYEEIRSPISRLTADEKGELKQELRKLSDVINKIETFIKKGE